MKSLIKVENKIVKVDSAIKIANKLLDVADGLPDLIPYRKEDKWGFCDRKKKIIIDCIYERAYPFFNGLARVILNNKYGFIDQQGNLYIKNIYEESFDFSGDFARVKSLNRWGCIDKSGAIVVPINYEDLQDFTEGIAAFKLDGLWGFIDINNYPIIENKYRSVDSFSDGLAPVEGRDEIGYISYCGLLQFPPKQEQWFDRVCKFSEGVAWVHYFGVLFLIDISGKYVTNIGWESMWGKEFSEHLAVVQYNNKQGGFVNKDLEITIPFIYEDCKSFKDGMAPVKFGGKWGYINKGNKTILPFIYDDAEEFFGGLALVRHSDSYLYIDKKGTQYWED
jgi:hypothetical protein